MSYDWLVTGRGDDEPPPHADIIDLARRIERVDDAAKEYIKVILSTAEHRQNLA